MAVGPSIHDVNGVNGTNGCNGDQRQRIVVVGLGMVGIAFIEKLLKLDAKRRRYTVVVIGEEPHLAYNRVSLSTYFEHRNIEDLYLNSKEWYSSFDADALSYHLNTRVTEIHPAEKQVRTADALISYDILVLATGSDASLPTNTPGYDAKGVFVYRTLDDLERLIEFSADHKGEVGVTVGGGLLGLEAAKSMMDMDVFAAVKLVDRNRWVLSRQLDGDAGTLVTEKVRELGLQVLLRKRIARIEVDDGNNVVGVTFEDGGRIDCCCICFAIGVKPRDDIARAAGLRCASIGGLVINEQLQTSDPDIYAIGECASWENKTFGIIAPGIDMADVLSFNLTRDLSQEPKAFKRPDMSTKLKLLGVEVASFGDFFADRDGPKTLPERYMAGGHGADGNASGHPSPVKALTYKDPFGAVYKKYLFTPDGKYLLGGMMIGDTSDYIKLNQMVKNQKELDVPPSEFILGQKKADDGGVDDLDDDTQICSCHNVLKCDVVDSVKNGTCKTINDVKTCTKAGTGCGGCMPTVQAIFNSTLKSMGQEVSNHVCQHFAYSRADLCNVISVKRLQTFTDVMRECGKSPESLGCEICKPAIGSILSSLFNRHIMDQKLHSLQDTNDKFLANIQRNGTFSVVPRVPGGEITPDKLIVLGQVAQKYNLYCKITGGQRIDLFGAKKDDLLDIWRELVNAGMESGHAYAKSLRTIKSCVGTTWCRFGIGDSVGMAIRLENRYKSIRSPHKLKGAVSGCVRECAEAQNKDFGLIATEKGYNLFVGGNGGAQPRHCDLLAKDVPPEEIIPMIDRYLMFYIRTADRLQRTARWIEALPGGIEYLKDVVIHDKLGICADLEKQMEELVGSYFCEWTETLKRPELQKHFKQFGNTDDQIEGVEIIKEREQERPTNWPQTPAEHDFKGHQWSTVAWQPLIKEDYFSDGPPAVSSANVKRGNTQLAVFKIKGKYYATQQMCPHKRAFILSDGLIGDDDSGKYWVSCPYHKRNFELNGEQAGRCSNDETLNIATFPVECRDDGWVYVKLPPVEELDSVLGTDKWKVRKEDGRNPFEKVDKIYKGMKARKGGAGGTVYRKTAAANEGIDW